MSDDDKTETQVDTPGGGTVKESTPAPDTGGDEGGNDADTSGDE